MTDLAETPAQRILTDDEAERIAHVAHDANRAWGRSIGDRSQDQWEFAPPWQRRVVIDGVRFLEANPEATPEASHENWMAGRLAAGWTFGETKDVYAKTHPCIAPYADLPAEQRVKGAIFHGVVRAMISAARQG